MITLGYEKVWMGMAQVTDSLSVTQFIFIIIGILFGTIGLFMLAFGQARHRIVGIMLTPIIVAMVFFLLNFTSQSSADFSIIGQAGGAFAGYLIVVVLLYRLMKPTLDMDSLIVSNQQLTNTITQLQAQLEQSQQDLSSSQQTYNQVKHKLDNRSTPPIKHMNRTAYELPDRTKRRIIIQCGDIEQIKHMEIRVDAIVSSENTDMMLARYYDGSISGTLRYMDASTDTRNYIAVDNLGNSLKHVLADLQVTPPVGRGAVYATPTTELAKRGIRYVLHAAAVYGKRQIRGYETDGGMLDLCVENAYTRFEEVAQTQIPANDPPLETIMFPLFGAGTAKLSPFTAADIIVKGIVTHMKDTPAVEITYLLAYTEGDLEAWVRALDHHNIPKVGAL